MAYEEAVMPSAVEADGLTDVPEATDPVAEHVTEEGSSAVGETAPAAEEAETVGLSEEAVFRPVYNGQEIPLKASQHEEITSLLQLGMKQRDFLPTYERLSFLAKEDGATSVRTWVERLVQEREDAYRELAVSRYGEEAGGRFYALERQERERRFAERDAQAQAQREATDGRLARQERLAAEMVELQEQYPQYRSVREVPPQVVELSLRENISLLDAHNRFALSERQRLERADTEGRRAACASTGSLRGEPAAPPSPMDAFLAGLHRRS